MKNKIATVKGTREFYPEEMALRNYLYQNVRAASQSFGYQEWDGPFLETVDLNAAKSGEELVNQQSFVFPDRGGDMITLLPELTPTLARMIAQRQRQLAYPLRWWSFGPFWLYERPQKGRTREFFQWSAEQGNNALARSSWVHKMVVNLQQGQAVTLPDAMHQTPVLANHLAEVSLRLMKEGKSGVYNVAGRDSVTRYEFMRSAPRFSASIRPLLSRELWENWRKAGDFQKISQGSCRPMPVWTSRRWKRP